MPIKLPGKKSWGFGNKYKTIKNEGSMKKLSLSVIGFLAVLFFVITASTYSLYAKDKILAEFNRAMKTIGVTFKKPAQFNPVPLIMEAREDVDYLYAIKHKKKKLEIRYSLFPYINQKNESGKTIASSDDTYKLFTYTVLLNIAGDEDKILRAGEFDKDAVKEEFNADWGSSNLVEAGNPFGDGYKYAMIVALFKSGSGHIYITYLFDDYKDIHEEFLSAFHSISFI